MPMKTHCLDFQVWERQLATAPVVTTAGFITKVTQQSRFPYTDPSQQLTMERALGQAISCGFGDITHHDIKDLMTFEDSPLTLSKLP